MSPGTKAFAELSFDLKEYVDKYPDIDALVAAGKLRRMLQAGWYELIDLDLLDVIGPYVDAMSQPKDGGLELRIRKLSRRLQSLAAKPPA